MGYVVAQHRQQNALVSCYHRDICIGDWSTWRLRRSGVVQGIVVAMGTLLGGGGVWLQHIQTNTPAHTHAHSPRRRKCSGRPVALHGAILMTNQHSNLNI